MIRFLVCSTDESTFDQHIVGQFPVIGTHERFAVPSDCFFDANFENQPIDLIIEELAELGITYLAMA